MNSSESPNAAACCSSPQLDQFMACVQRSEWDRAADLVGHLDSCWTWLKQVMDKALADQQWDWAVRLFKKCQEVQQTSGLVRELVNCNQWHGVVQLMEPQLSGEELDSVVHWAVQQCQWPWVTQMVDRAEGSGRWSEWLCQQAVDNGQWALVLRLIEMGVPGQLRNSLLQCALGHQHVQCTATLVDLGVSKHCREEGLRQQIAAGHGDFVLEVVRRVRDPDLTDFVLGESMKQSQWTLVSGLVKEGLSVAQMENVSNQAVVDQQWSIVLQLLRDGVSPSEFIVNEVFKNKKARDLLDLFPAGSVPEGLKGLLLMASIRHGLGDLALQILQRESVSDSELMEAIKYTVHVHDEPVFLKLITEYPRARRVFKQKFVHQHWKEDPQSPDSGEVSFMFYALWFEEETDLALLVATSIKTTCPCIEYFCENEWYRSDFKPKQFSYALTKLCEFDCKKYGSFILEIYEYSDTLKSKRSFLFRHTILMEQTKLTVDLSKYGVSRKDLKYAYWSLVQGEMNRDIFYKILFKLDKEEHDWLRQYAMKCSMKEYFKRRTDASLDIFHDQFFSCCDKELGDKIFRKAITKSVKLNCADCFVMLCTIGATSFDFKMGFFVQHEERAFAYNLAFDRKRSRFISKVCKEKVAEDGHLDRDEVLQLTEIIIEREAWRLLDHVRAGTDWWRFIDEQSVEKVFELMERFVLKMLLDQSAWPDIAATLEQWIRWCDVGDERLKRMLCSMEKKIAAGQWPVTVSSVTQWCVDNGHARLAFFLALVTKQLDMLRTVVTTFSSLKLRDNLLWRAVEVAAGARNFSTTAALMKLWPAESRYSVGTFRKRTQHLTYFTHSLARACEEQDMVHWALVLMSTNPEYILQKHRLCQNHHVLDFLLKQAVETKYWSIARALAPRCTDSNLLRVALIRAFEFGQDTLAELVIGRVDPTICYEEDEEESDNWFYRAVTSKSDVRVQMVRLCISAGLCTMEREEDRDHYNCALFKALRAADMRIVKLLLACGAISHKRLRKVEEDGLSRYRRFGWESLSDEQRRTGLGWVTEAASTPCRLQHLARLEVSRSIGCQPGRSDRIRSLPAPQPLKDLVNFKDVVSMNLRLCYYETVEEEEEAARGEMF